MLPGSVLIALFALTPCLSIQEEALPLAPLAQAADECASHWRPLDDPDALGIPQSLRTLPGERMALRGSLTSPSFLILRRLPAVEFPIDGFMADEEAMQIHGEFIPLADRPLDWEEEGDEAAFGFDCEWTQASMAARVATLYATAEDGSVLAAWLVTSGEETFEELHAELMQQVKRLSAPKRYSSTEKDRGVVLDHEVSFRLRMPAPEGQIRLVPEEQASEADRLFIEALTEVNPEFNTDVVRQWRDAERGASLSYQVICADGNLGGEQPFVIWLSGAFSLTLRQDEEKGDVPVELLHEAGALTRVVDDEEVDRHYANNVKAPDKGVILEVYLPKSPFARTCRIRWAERASAESSEVQYVMMKFVELREYRRSRSETITRNHVLCFYLRASSEADLDALEAGLNLTTRPLPPENGYAGPG